jgi:hypothetical protein
MTSAPPASGALQETPAEQEDASSSVTVADLKAQLRRRRKAADRMPPLVDGRRDPVDLLVCRRCGRRLARQATVWTREGPYCKRHADRLPPYLRRSR